VEMIGHGAFHRRDPVEDAADLRVVDVIGFHEPYTGHGFLLEAQKLCGISAQDRCLGLRSKLERADLLDGALEAERERIIGADDEAFGAEAVYELAQRGSIEREDVEPEPIEVRGGWTRDRRATVGQDFVPLVEAAEQRRERAARMVEEQPQPR